ncbi:MAG: hypothetical protein O6848_02935 [Bacteroidetes bacterium]|nr:hypothetical protein [Bacteroidota bacterium]
MTNSRNFIAIIIIGIIPICLLSNVRPAHKLYALTLEQKIHLFPTDSTKKDSVKIKKKPKDPIPQKSENFYKTIKKDLYKHKMTKMLYKTLFRIKHSDTTNLQKEKEAKDKNPYLLYHGKVIRNIHIQRMEVFGTDIRDTTKVPDHGFLKTANSLHVKTEKNIIRHNLLFREGMLLDASEIKHNERVIRSLRFIKDARIYVVPSDSNEYFVDLIVVTKDVYPISFGVSARGVDEFKFALNHINILGFGHEMDNEFQFNKIEEQEFGYDGAYRIPNIRGTFVTGEVRYANTVTEDFTGIRFFRNFITPDIKNAGGIEISTQRLRQIKQLNDTTFVRFNTKVELQDLWLGRSYRSFYDPPVIHVKERLRLVVAGRVSRKHYVTRPVVSADTNKTYRNTTLFLASVGMSHRSYFKDRLIFAFGRTEDVPLGYLSELTGGYESGEFFDRWYSGIRVSKGGYFRNHGYLNGAIEIGGFIKQRRFDQGVLSGRLLFFNHLYQLGNSQLRLFINLRYLLGIRRFDDELVSIGLRRFEDVFLSINDRNGIRGLESSRLIGQQKFVINTETVLFTPLNIIGFQLALAVFADLGWINPNDVAPFSGGFYQGYGVGFRFRNDNLAFNTFQIRIGFYPGEPIDADGFAVDFGSIPRLNLNDFDVRSPSILEFN